MRSYVDLYPSLSLMFTVFCNCCKYIAIVCMYVKIVVFVVSIFREPCKCNLSISAGIWFEALGGAAL